jgi:methionyl-tRNA formyltransferase
MREKEFTARELMDELMSIDERMYEEVLDKISEHHNRNIEDNEEGFAYFAWCSADDGKMLMYLEGEEK